MVCFNTSRSISRYGSRGKEFYSIIDGAFASMLILITAVNEGIGACFVGAFQDKMMSAILELPKHVKPIGIVCIGYPADIYKHFKEDVFPRLLEDTDVPTSDKQIIQDLLKKPWNPYIQRHNAMTATAKILKESMLRVHAGRGPNSKMPQIYLHYFGNESSENLLEIYRYQNKG